MQRVFEIACSECHVATVLPRRSLLGIFEHPQRQPSDAWPINYLCSECGHLSERVHAPLHPVGIEFPVHNLPDYRLVCYEFEKQNDKKKTLVFSRIFPTLRAEEDLAESIRIAGNLPGKPRLLRHFVIDP